MSGQCRGPRKMSIDYEVSLMFAIRLSSASKEAKCGAEVQGEKCGNV